MPIGVSALVGAGTWPLPPDPPSHVQGKHEMCQRGGKLEVDLGHTNFCGGLGPPAPRNRAKQWLAHGPLPNGTHPIDCGVHKGSRRTNPCLPCFRPPARPRDNIFRGRGPHARPRTITKDGEHTPSRLRLCTTKYRSPLLEVSESAAVNTMGMDARPMNTTVR